MSSRLEFVLLALKPGANMRALCRTYGVSPMTGYKLLSRYKDLGEQGLLDQSRRPSSSPRRSSDELEALVLALHEKYPCWSGRKLQCLFPQGIPPPHHSTIDAILRRHGKSIQIDGTKAPAARHRFEHPAPNCLWQMDFKGHFALTHAQSGRCHPLTVLDDHSRFSLGIKACSNERRETVQEALTRIFRTYGLPERITCDNGAPWGSHTKGCLSAFDVWLVRLGIRPSHSRPYHPQTQGKDERFHRTLKFEVIDRQGFGSIEACQEAFDSWRDLYNLIRPHDSLEKKPPISRYQASARPFPETLPTIEYETGAQVRKVKANGYISFKGGEFFVGEGLFGQPVAIQAGSTKGTHTVWFCSQLVGKIDLRKTT
jgi:transposase InsO family protein